jgi:hypothetical protein
VATLVARTKVPFSIQNAESSLSFIIKITHPMGREYGTVFYSRCVLRE